MYNLYMGCIYHVLRINKFICTMKIDIHEIDSADYKVEFGIDNIDYKCFYDIHEIRQEYPVSFNTITSKTTYAIDEFLYRVPDIKTLEREDNEPVVDPSEICRWLELRINSYDYE